MSREAGARGTPQPGDTVDGKYELVRLLGEGGMGLVFEAEHLRLKQRCAIKMLSPELLRETDIIQRFEREARASALIRSPHVTRVTDVATTADGVPYIVMELLSGRDLDRELEQRGRLPYPEAVDYVLQACAAIAEAHAAGIIHRDLEPGNLFLAHDPDGVIVKVLDFGISKMVEDGPKLTSAGMTMGTALYTSPEQLRSAATVDARSDIWSLGVILYELLCGDPPWSGSATKVAAAVVTEDAPDITRRCAIPPALGAIIHRALRRAPAERFASAGELATALAPFAPPNSLGAAVGVQISRRGISRSLAVEAAAISAARTQAAEGRSEALTLREVSTSVSHEVGRPATQHDSLSRQLLIAVLAVIVVVTLGAVAGAVVFVRRAGSDASRSAAGSASATTASGASGTSGATRLASGGAAQVAASAEPAAVVAATETATATTTEPAPPSTGAREVHATSTPAAAGAGTGTSTGTSSPVPTVRAARPGPSAVTNTAPAPRPTATTRPPAGPAPTAPQFL